MVKAYRAYSSMEPVREAEEAFSYPDLPPTPPQRTSSTSGNVRKTSAVKFDQVRVREIPRKSPHRELSLEYHPPTPPTNRRKMSTVVTEMSAPRRSPSPRRSLERLTVEEAHQQAYYKAPSPPQVQRKKKGSPFVFRKKKQRQRSPSFDKKPLPPSPSESDSFSSPERDLPPLAPQSVERSPSLKRRDSPLPPQKPSSVAIQKSYGTGGNDTPPPSQEDYYSSSQDEPAPYSRRRSQSLKRQGSIHRSLTDMFITGPQRRRSLSRNASMSSLGRSQDSLNRSTHSLGRSRRSQYEATKVVGGDGERRARQRSRSRDTLPFLPVLGRSRSNSMVRRKSLSLSREASLEMVIQQDPSGRNNESRHFDSPRLMRRGSGSSHSLKLHRSKSREQLPMLPIMGKNKNRRRSVSREEVVEFMIEEPSLGHGNMSSNRSNKHRKKVPQETNPPRYNRDDEYRRHPHVGRDDEENKRHPHIGRDDEENRRRPHIGRDDEENRRHPHIARDEELTKSYSDNKMSPNVARKPHSGILRNGSQSREHLAREDFRSQVHKSSSVATARTIEKDQPKSLFDSPTLRRSASAVQNGILRNRSRSREALSRNDKKRQSWGREEVMEFIADSSLTNVNVSQLPNRDTESSPERIGHLRRARSRSRSVEILPEHRVRRKDFEPEKENSSDSLENRVHGSEKRQMRKHLRTVSERNKSSSREDLRAKMSREDILATRLRNHHYEDLDKLRGEASSASSSSMSSTREARESRSRSNKKETKVLHFPAYPPRNRSRMGESTSKEVSRRRAKDGKTMFETDL